jgi:hypothetical protein
MAMDIIDFLHFRHWSDCKIHLASWNGDENPLDVFVRDRIEWSKWNEYRGVRNVFNKRYIFTLIDVYQEADVWLFGGFFRVLATHSDRYEVVLCEDHQDLIGRLKLQFKRPGRSKSIGTEYLAAMQLLEVLRKPYQGEDFPGFENIDHGFDALEVVMREAKPDWRSALQSVKGVYLVTDISNGKRYVGSAYGINGVWDRWSSYVRSGHGYTDELTKVIEEHGLDYARSNFKFSLLEWFPSRTLDVAIILREGYWKKLLMTRGAYGYNRN